MCWMAQTSRKSARSKIPAAYSLHGAALMDAIGDQFSGGCSVAAGSVSVWLFTAGGRAKGSHWRILSSVIAKTACAAQMAVPAAALLPPLEMGIAILCLARW